MAHPNWKLEQERAGTRWTEPGEGVSVGELWDAVPMCPPREGIGQVLAEHHPGACTNIYLTGDPLIGLDFENIRQVTVGRETESEEL